MLALIPHFKCEEWLDDCLASLCAQTRPLDGIVVIDDASGDPPVEIVERHPRRDAAARRARTSVPTGSSSR